MVKPLEVLKMENHKILEDNGKITLYELDKVEEEFGYNSKNNLPNPHIAFVPTDWFKSYEKSKDTEYMDKEQKETYDFFIENKPTIKNTLDFFIEKVKNRTSYVKDYLEKREENPNLTQDYVGVLKEELVPKYCNWVDFKTIPFLDLWEDVKKLQLQSDYHLRHSLLFASLKEEPQTIKKANDISWRTNPLTWVTHGSGLKKSSEEYVKDIQKNIEEGKLEGEIPYSRSNNDIPQNCRTSAHFRNQYYEALGLEERINPKEVAEQMKKDFNDYGALLEEYDREVIQPIINTIESYK